jgi:16S rRNA (cytosine967-C5)-methyltransferase
MAAATLAPAPLFFRANGFSPRHHEVPQADAIIPADGHPGFFRSSSPLPVAWFDDGRIAVQDPAAALATDLLDPAEGEWILDACASPGGKTRRLAEMAGGKAHITATDMHGRLIRLQENLSRWQVPGVTCRAVDWTTPTGPWPAFDAILVDAPCTNTGVLRRRLDARHRFSESTLAQAAATQKMILDATAPLLKPGGRLVYSTCSLEPEENILQIEAFLARHPGWKLAGEKQLLHQADGADGHFAALLLCPFPA